MKLAARLRSIAGALLLGMTAVAPAVAEETPLRVFGLLAGGRWSGELIVWASPVRRL
jgi:hypothetical protein